MNRILRSRLSIIAYVLLIPIILLGCDPESCREAAIAVCTIGCTPPCGLASLIDPFLYFWCMLACGVVCLSPWAEVCPSSLACAENPEQCAASFEQLQLAAIEFCDEHPEECQQAFDAWVASLDEEDTE